MFTFPKPRYLTKRVNPITQKIEPSYQFDVQCKGVIKESPICLFLDSSSSFTIKDLEKELNDQKEWLTEFLQSFLSATNSYFSRPYTVQHLQRLIQHLCNLQVPSSELSPVCIYFIPNVLELIGGKLLVHWKYEISPTKIHIPDDGDDDVSLSLPVLKAPEGGLEEWDIESVPEEKNATEESYFDSMDPAMLLERQRVKEAKLKAKLAMYRAQMEMNRFYDKYGDEVSDSEPDSGEEEEDEEEEDDE